MPRDKHKKAQYDKDRYKAKKEQILQTAKIYSEKNKEKIAKNKKLYYKKNKDEIQKKTKDYQDKNKKMLYEASKRWGKNNKEKVLKTKKKYRYYAISNLKDSYVIDKIRRSTGLTSSQIPQGLIEAKRAELKLKRLIKGAENENTTGN